MAPTRECFIAHGSYIPNQCPSCSGFELFFDSLGDRFKKKQAFLTPSPSSGETHLCPRHDTPSTDLVVGVTSEQSLAVGRPGQGDTLGVTGLLALLDVLGLELINLALLLEVEDGDRAAGGSAQPVAVGGEDEGVDLVTGVEGVEVLGLVQVPEHGGTVLATGGAEGAVGRDGDGVDVASVTDVVGLQAAGSELPNLIVNNCQHSIRARPRAIEAEFSASSSLNTKG